MDFHLANFKGNYHQISVWFLWGMLNLSSKFIVGQVGCSFGGALINVWMLSLADLNVGYSLENPPTIMLITPLVALE